MRSKLSVWQLPSINFKKKLKFSNLNFIRIARGFSITKQKTLIRIVCSAINTPFYLRFEAPQRLTYFFKSLTSLFILCYSLEQNIVLFVIIVFCNRFAFYFFSNVNICSKTAQCVIRVAVTSYVSFLRV